MLTMKKGTGPEFLWLCSTLSTLKLESVCSSETWRYIPGNHVHGIRTPRRKETEIRPAKRELYWTHPT